MDKGKFVNLVKETELGLFRANKQAKELGKLSDGTAGLLNNLLAIAQAVERFPKLEQELSEQLKQRRLVGQARELFGQIDLIENGLKNLSGLRERAAPFVESHRTGRVYSFKDSISAIKFAKQAMEVFSVQSVLFKPRFLATINLDEVAGTLKLKSSGPGLVLQPKDIKAFVKHMSLKRLASNISLEAAGLKLVWHDKRTVAVEASSERLYRMDRLCDVFEGKCIEK